MLERLQVLYLDDSSANLHAVESALHGLECQVVTANSLGEAARLVPTSDLVIIDFHMPQANGAEAVKRLRKSEVRPSTAFYLYTTDTSVAAEYRSHGFDGAFTGKGDMEVLVAQVGTALRLLKLRRFIAQKRVG
jgi:CheY-like chemotaxis protein